MIREFINKADIPDNILNHFDLNDWCSVDDDWWAQYNPLRDVNKPKELEKLLSIILNTPHEIFNIILHVIPNYVAEHADHYCSKTIILPLKDSQATFYIKDSSGRKYTKSLKRGYHYQFNDHFDHGVINPEKEVLYILSIDFLGKPYNYRCKNCVR